MKKLKLLFTFYRNFLFVSLVISVCCFKIFKGLGIATFSSLFWFKVFTLAIIFFFISSYKAKELYYYQNLGLSKRFLFGVTLSFDFLWFLIILYIIHKTA